MIKKVICQNCNIEFKCKIWKEQKYCSRKCVYQKQTKSLIEKYEMYIIKNPGDQCWSWKGHTAHGGYGMTSNNNKGLRAHRASWILHNGEIPEGMFVLHHCDNPICSNPKHLFLGTQKDNICDAKMKGRHKHIPSNGEKNANSKLNSIQVREIKELLNNNKSHREIAEMFNIGRPSITNIKNGKTWAHLTKE